VALPVRMQPAAEVFDRVGFGVGEQHMACNGACSHVAKRQLHSEMRRGAVRALHGSRCAEVISAAEVSVAHELADSVHGHLAGRSGAIRYTEVEVTPVD